MSAPLTPAKRQHYRTLKQTNAKKNWKNSAKSSPDTLVFRLLCPASKTGSIIGKGGAVISQIRQETGVNVKVEETVAGCDERLVIISGSEKETDVDVGKNGNLTDKTEGEAHPAEGTDSTDGADITKESLITEEVSGTKEGGDEKKLDENEQSNQNDENKGSNNNTDSSKSVKENVQKALLLVFERIVVAEPEIDGVSDQTVKSSAIVLRLLVLSTQVGGLLGKAGSIIKQLSATSGAQIRILPKDKFPLCASPSDEVVQITGEVDSVRKALQAVSLQLLGKSVFKDLPSKIGGPSEVHPSNQSLTDFHPSTRNVMPKIHESGLHSRMKIPQEFFTVRVVCPMEKVGSVIGKGGTIVRSIQQETGCEIKIADESFDSENSIIAISGHVHPRDRISAVQDAVLRVLTRFSRTSPDSNENNAMSARLLVSSYQIGCLLGKGGVIIAEMRKSSGAYIRKLPKEQIPNHLSGEDVVQISGNHEAFEDALLQITARLQHDFFREAFPLANHHPSNPPFPFPFHSFSDRREFSPPRMYPNFGPLFHGGPHRPGGFHSLDDFRREGVSPLMPERKPWGLQGLMEDGCPLGIPEFAGRRIMDLGGSKPAIITSTTLEVVVPSYLVPAIYGEDGFCLHQIREISDAKVIIIDPKPGARETAIVISGTPEQTNAAQSLIQAFVMIETESA